MRSDSLDNQLANICSIIQRSSLAASICGEGAERFVRSQHGDRTAELSHDGVGFFVELFEKPTEESIYDYQQASLWDAAQQAIEWLLRKPINA